MGVPTPRELSLIRGLICGWTLGVALCGAAVAEDCAALFDSRRIVLVEITVDPAEWAETSEPSDETRAAAGPRPDREFHGARLVCGDGRPLAVGVRRFAAREGNTRQALEVAVDRFVPGRTIAGERGFALYPGIHARETVGEDATKRGFVDLTVNGEFIGVYTAVSEPASQVTGRTAGPDGSADKAAPVVHGALVVINEVLANTPGGNDVEYIELYNAGFAPQDLTGWYLLDDGDLHDPCVLEGTLAPGDFLVVPGIRSRFEARFPGVPLAAGQCDSVDGSSGFGLGNGDDIVRLYRDDATQDELIDVLTYGRQGVDVAFGYRPQDTDAAEYLESPTPGAANEGSELHSPVCINEFLTTSMTGGIDDWVELYNRGDSAVDISGWFLSDDASTPRRYAIPAGTVIPPGGYWTVDEMSLGFSFSSTGSEVLLLTHADGVTGQDYYDFGPQFADVSQGRFPDGSPNWHFFVDPSRNATNTCETGPSPPARVSGLTFVAPDAIVWGVSSGADAYDVLAGDLVGLRDAGGDFSAAVDKCAANNRTGTLAPAAAIPANAGDGVFYLVRGVHFACGFGSYGTGFLSQAADRDAAIAAAPQRCP